MTDTQPPANTYIPLIPFVLEGDLRIIVTEAFAKGGVDMARIVQAPFASKEISSPDGRPAEEIVLRRFVQHFARTRVNLMQDVLLALHYRSDAQGFLEMMKFLKKELPFLPIDEHARHVLLIEDGGAANAFMKEVHTLGFPEDAIATKGSFLDGLHKGARLVNREFGKFFIITWSPTISNADLGRVLRAWLTKGPEQHLHEGDRHSMTPGQAFPAFEIPTIVQSSDGRRESPFPPPASNKHFGAVGSILGRLKRRS